MSACVNKKLIVVILSLDLVHNFAVILEEKKKQNKNFKILQPKF